MAACKAIGSPPAKTFKTWVCGPEGISKEGIYPADNVVQSIIPKSTSSVLIHPCDTVTN